MSSYLLTHMVPSQVYRTFYQARYENNNMHGCQVENGKSRFEHIYAAKRAVRLSYVSFRLTGSG